MKESRLPYQFASFPGGDREKDRTAEREQRNRDTAVPVMSHLTGGKSKTAARGLRGDCRPCKTKNMYE